MANRRTNSLHRKLAREVLAEINRALVERPEGLQTYRQIYDHWRLQAAGISFAAFARHARVIELMVRDRAVRSLADRVTDIEGLGAKNAALIRTRLFEVLTDEQARPSDILNLVMADSAAVRTGIKREEWEAKKQQIAAALEKSQSEEASHDPARALENLRASIQTIYGITPPEK